LNIKYAYCVELRPDAESNDGFILPEAHIAMAGLEIYTGVKAILAEILRSP
jgi:hypothetical protein